MAKLIAHAEVAAILARGTFGELVGALEAEHLECKAAPYHLQHDHQKFELAKDVSMIVNWLARHGGDGAHLLLGVATEKSTEHHADMVASVSPFPQSLVYPKQYYDVLHSRLLPPPEGLRVEWCPSAEDATQGIVAITIPRQPADRWPCLITHMLETSGKADGRSIAYVERRGEHSVPWTAPDFQRLLREGARAEVVSRQIEALSERFDGLQQQLTQPAAARAPSPSQALQHYRDRRDHAVTAAGLRGLPVYALTAAPVETVEIPRLFRGAKDPLVQFLSDPPALRHAGFDMQVRNDLAVVEGRVRRAVGPGSKLLECWPDGTLIHVVDAESFLCWGNKTKGNVLRVNPLALAESTFLFATLAQGVYLGWATPRPEAVRFGLALHNLDVGGRVAVLTPGRVSSQGYQWNMDPKEAPAGSAEFTVDVAGVWKPGEVAYQLCAQVYRWFGHTDEEVPYVEEAEDGARSISKGRILAVG